MSRQFVRLWLVSLLFLVSSAEYVYEDGNWIWKDEAVPIEKTNDYGDSEGSGDYYDSDDDYYYEGSGEEYYEDYSDKDREDSYNSRTDWQSNSKVDKNENINYNNNNWNNNNNDNSYSKNNDEDIQLTDEVKSTAVVVTTTTLPTTVVKLSTKPILVGNTNLHPTSFFAQPGILAAVVGGAVVGLLCAILLVMFIVYRMRKKDEGSYSLDEPRRSPAAANLYVKANSREFFA